MFVTILFDHSFCNIKLFYYHINNLIFDHGNIWATSFIRLLYHYLNILLYDYSIVLFFVMYWYSHIITLTDTFSTIIFAPGQFYITDLELLSTVPST